VNCIATNSKPNKYWGLSYKPSNFHTNKSINILIYKISDSILAFTFIRKTFECNKTSLKYWDEEKYKYIIESNATDTFRCIVNEKEFEQYISDIDKKMSSNKLTKDEAMKEIKNLSSEKKLEHHEYAENILFPYFCNDNDINFLHIEQKNEFLLKPISENTKRPDYVIQKNSPFSVYIDVKSLKTEPSTVPKEYFSISTEDIEMLNIYKPFVFLAIYDRYTQVQKYMNMYYPITIENAFPIPKFISITDVQELPVTKLSYYNKLEAKEVEYDGYKIPIANLKDFDSTLEGTIIESFYNKKWKND